MENTTSVTALSSNCVDGPVWTVMVPGLSSEIAVDEDANADQENRGEQPEHGATLVWRCALSFGEPFLRRPSMEMRSPG